MRRTVLYISLLLATVLLLSACGSGANTATNNEVADNAGNASGDLVSDSSPAATCTVYSQEVPDLAREDDHIIGETEDYSVTIIAYNDFSCSGCLTIAQTLAKTLELYPDDVRLIYRFFPVLGGNDNAVVAAKAVEAAGRQGMFWEMHDFFFATQDAWKEMDQDTFSQYIWDQVAALGIESEQFNLDVNSDEISQKIAQHYDEAQNFGVTPPVVLVNGTTAPPYLNTVQDFFVWLDTLMIPYGRHIQDQQYSECPPMTVDTDADYTATLHTEKGDVLLALYPDVAPVTVNNFIFLAENDYYDNTPFYAVINGFIAQAGDPSGTGWGNPGFLYDLEVSADLTFERPYMLAMGNSGPETSNSQFFITFNPLTYLNGQYTIFGEVLDGIDVLQSLTLRDPERAPLQPMSEMILDITVEKQ